MKNHERPGSFGVLRVQTDIDRQIFFQSFSGGLDTLKYNMEKFDFRDQFFYRNKHNTASTLSV